MLLCLFPFMGTIAQVNSIDEFQSAINSAKPGEIITLKNGVYTTDKPVIIACAGAKDKPVIIQAETVGGVEIRGTHGFTFDNAAYVVASGFNFTHAAGGNTIKINAHNIHINRCTFGPSNGPGYYLGVRGDDCEISYCEFRDKDRVGNMIDVAGENGQVARRLHIHHSYFHDFKKSSVEGEGNGLEVIRLGLSGLSMSYGYGLVEYNLFVRCEGENELITNKSCGNTYRYNTFLDSRGAQLTLRHGNDCIAEKNYFRNTDGLRIFGDRNKVRENYFEQNTLGINIGNGGAEVADGAPLTSHDRPDSTEITKNVMVNNRISYFMGARNNGLGATFTNFSENIISGGETAVRIEGPYPDAVWKDNVIWQAGSISYIPESGYKEINPGTLSPQKLGIPILTPADVGPASGNTLSSAGKSEWVWLNDQNRLEYKTTDKGDRIIDFSHAGYKGGGVALPDVSVKKTVSPLPDGGDCTQLIQNAINEVSSMPADANGFRGAVLLSPGEFNAAGTLQISTDGVVLRGSVAASGELQSTLRMNAPRLNNDRLAIRISAPQQRGSNQRQQSQSVDAPTETLLADEYVPCGTQTFRVKSVSGFQVGDQIEIRHPVTKKWIEYLVMHNLVRDGKPQTWIAEGQQIATTRTITAISGDRFTIDVPLVDAYDANYLNPPGTVVAKVTRPSTLIKQAGIEYLRIACPEQAVGHGDAQFEAVRINGEDCWMRNVRVEETMNSIAVTGRRITLQYVDVIRKAMHQGASRPAEFAPNGGQVLLDRCTVEADNVWFVATGGNVMGPIVILNCTFKGNSRAEGHQRWSTAMMYDNCSIPDGRLDISNRGLSGSGHGWALAWSVAWNCVSKEYLIQEPPGTRNWAIGCIGRSVQAPRLNDPTSPILPEGTFDSRNVPVAPKSLYLTQLLERLGPVALKNIGY